jgi:hypothetical protein
MNETEPIRIAGTEMPSEQRTPLLEALLRIIEQQRAEIQQLRDEIARLKGLPRRPAIRPSTLNSPHPDPANKKRRSDDGAIGPVRPNVARPTSGVYSP